MLVLIELYDAEEPVHNILSLSAFRPEHMAVLCRGRKQEILAQKTLENYIHSAGLNTQLTFYLCEPFDLNSTEQILERILDEYGADNCLIDVIGGNELLLLAVGSTAAGKNIRIVTQEKYGNGFIWLKGNPIVPQNPDFAITVSQAIALSGGELTRNARVSEKVFQSDFMRIVPDVFSVYMKYRKKWPLFVLYMQQVNRPEYMHCEPNGKLRCIVPKVLYSGKKRLNPQALLFHDLEQAGALTSFIEEENRYQIVFSSDEALKYLCDVGSWLELYSYHLFCTCGSFCDVQMSAVISWDNDSDREDIINEIDLVATEGKGQLFVSCKTALPDNAVLNEIAALTSRFGSAYAIPVLITASHLEKEAPAVYRRAAEMGICVFDANDLNEEEFRKRIEILRRRWL